MSARKMAALRTCASCEWIFRFVDGVCQDCPKCGFGSYGARYVYGAKAYSYEKTQKPWFDRAMAKYAEQLRRQLPERKITSYLHADSSGFVD